MGQNKATPILPRKHIERQGEQEPKQGRRKRKKMVDRVLTCKLSKARTWDS